MIATNRLPVQEKNGFAKGEGEGRGRELRIADCGLHAGNFLAAFGRKALVGAVPGLSRCIQLAGALGPEVARGCIRDVVPRPPSAGEHWQANALLFAFGFAFRRTRMSALSGRGKGNAPPDSRDIPVAAGSAPGSSECTSLPVLCDLKSQGVACATLSPARLRWASISKLMHSYLPSGGQECPLYRGKETASKSPIAARFLSRRVAAGIIEESVAGARGAVPLPGYCQSVPPRCPAAGARRMAYGPATRRRKRRASSNMKTLLNMQ